MSGGVKDMRVGGPTREVKSCCKTAPERPRIDSKSVPGRLPHRRPKPTPDRHQVVTPSTHRQLRDELAQLWREVAQFLANLSNFGATSLSFWRTWSVLARVRPIFGANLPNVGAMSANLRRELDQPWREIIHSSANLANSGAKMVNVRRNWPCDRWYAPLVCAAQFWLCCGGPLPDPLTAPRRCAWLGVGPSRTSLGVGRGWWEARRSVPGPQADPSRPRSLPTSAPDGPRSIDTDEEASPERRKDVFVQK